ncbi:MAG: CRTAC1 family protein [Acidobacteria bacterium]|nr:MAG: CRTAC1 family protein [Acidobacteriota bacterium]
MRGGIRTRSFGTTVMAHSHVTFETGVGELHYPTQTAAWADYDLDGHLDLYIGNETTKALRAPAQLFHNNGDGTFENVAARAAVTNLRFTKAVTWGDYNADRWPDLFVSNLRGANRLYQNNGDGTFTDKAAELGVTDPRASFPAWFWDFDNDGHLDLFVSAYSADITHIAASYLNLPLDIEMAALYRGDGRGGFDNVATKTGLTRPTAPMGANFGDLDNDGYLDFYLGTGYPDYEELMPNVMYLNRDGERFLDVTSIGGFGHLQKGHGIAFVDFDGDGDQDVFEQMGGALAGDSFEDVLYENPGFGNHWLAIRLIGRETNRSAIGSRIRVEIREAGNIRSVYRHVNSGGSFGANPLEQTIGLGKAEEIIAVEIYWPKTDRRQTLRDVPLDRRLVILESGAWFVFE